MVEQRVDTIAQEHGKEDPGEILESKLGKGDREVKIGVGWGGWGRE